MGGRAMRAAAGAAALAVASTAALSAYVRISARPYLYPVATAPGVPVALVLGAEVYPGGRPSRFLRGRLDVAAALFHAGKAGVILVSGGHAGLDADEPTAMRNYLVAAGVPVGKVLLDPAGLDTFVSCCRARDVFDVRRLAVVSQTYHLPRAVAICRALGLEVVGVGDESVRSSRAVWASGVRREVLANFKMVWDLATARVPGRARAEPRG